MTRVRLCSTDSRLCVRLNEIPNDWYSGGGMRKLLVVYNIGRGMRGIELLIIYFEILTFWGWGGIVSSVSNSNEVAIFNFGGSSSSYSGSLHNQLYCIGIGSGIFCKCL